MRPPRERDDGDSVYINDAATVEVLGKGDEVRGGSLADEWDSLTLNTLGSVQTWAP